MSTEPTPPVAVPLSQPNRARDRLRLLALLALVVLWIGPVWVTVQVGDGNADEGGAVRSGITAALAMLALWGLAATSLGARTVRGLRIGGALTDAAVALTTTLVLVAGHPWIPGGALREAWVPIFLPLTLLALLDAIVLARRADPGYAISVIRAVAALFAAGALAVSMDWIPAGILFWLGIAPLMFLKMRKPREARRSLEMFVLVAGAAAGLAPWIQKTVIGWNPAVGGKDLSLWVYLWCVTAALIVTTAIDGMLRPEAES